MYYNSKVPPLLQSPLVSTQNLLLISVGLPELHVSVCPPVFYLALSIGRVLLFQSTLFLKWGFRPSAEHTETFPLMDFSFSQLARQSCHFLQVGKSGTTELNEDPPYCNPVLPQLICYAKLIFSQCFCRDQLSAGFSVGSISSGTRSEIPYQRSWCHN